MEVLDHIPVDLDRDTILAKLRMDKDRREAGDIQELIGVVAPIINPKAVYEVSYIEYRDADRVDIAGVTFESRVLSVNLKDVERVFPYIVTCGREVDEIVTPSGDFLKQFLLDAIKENALHEASRYLVNHITHKYALKQVSKMIPGGGSQDLWPLEQQRQLFSIFGDVERLIGVALTDTCLMIPIKSLSGILFPTEVSFQSCQLCPREKCPGRQAPYDEDLLKSFYPDRRKPRL